MSQYFTSIQLSSPGTLEGIQSAISIALQKDSEALLLLIGSESDIDFNSLPALLKAQPVPSAAVVLPAVIHETDLYPGATLICGLKAAGSVFLITEINKPENDLCDVLSNRLNREAPTNNAILFIDGLSSGVDDFISCLFDQVGPDMNIIGCGSGHHDFSSRPNIFTAEGGWNNAALLIFQSPSFTTSYHHGWEAVAGPFLVTRAKNNQIHDINFQPALPFYKDIVEQHSNKAFESDNFFNTSSQYPIGLEQLECEYLVRDLISCKGTSIECAGTVPSNAMVYVLHADEEQLISAAGQAAAQLCEKLSPIYDTDEERYVFIVDCVSRKLIFADRFHLELESIRKNLPEKAKIIGVLSIGEIANNSQGNIQFLNKTTVIGGLSK
jgi:hypothetical protein